MPLWLLGNSMSFLRCGLYQGCGSGYFVNHFRFHTYRFCFQQNLGSYLIYELADKHDYQNQQLTIYKGTLLVKMIA